MKVYFKAADGYFDAAILSSRANGLVILIDDTIDPLEAMFSDQEPEPRPPPEQPEEQQPEEPPQE